jgi:hypothetical protein
LDRLEFIDSVIENLAWPFAAVWLAFLLRGRVLEAIGRLTGIEGFGLRAEFERTASEIRVQVEEQVEEQVDEKRAEDQRDAKKQTGPGTGLVERATSQSDEGGGHGEQNASGSYTKAGGLLGDRDPALAESLNPLEKATVPERDLYADELLQDMFISTHELSVLSGNLGGSSQYPPRSAILESWRNVGASVRDLHALTIGMDGKRSTIHSVDDLAIGGIISVDTARTISAMWELRERVVNDRGRDISADAARDYVRSALGILKILSGVVQRYRRQARNAGAGDVAARNQA